MPNPSRRKTRLGLVPTIHQEIEKTKCRPRPRLATGDGSKPRRRLGPHHPRRRRVRSAHHEIRAWEDCFNDNCNESRWEKVEAGYYPRQVREEGPLSKNDRREHKKRRAVRTRLEREGGEKTVVPDVEARKKRSWTSESNTIAPRKPSSQKTTTSNHSITKRRNSNEPTSEPNRGCATSGV